MWSISLYRWPYYLIMDGSKRARYTGSYKERLTLKSITEYEGTFETLGLETPILVAGEPTAYASELFYDPVTDAEFIEGITRSYVAMQRLYFNHHNGRRQGRRPRDFSSVAIPMHPVYDRNVWKLFLGEDRTVPMTYSDIDMLLLQQVDGFDAKMQQLKTDKLRFHRELLADKDFLHVLVGDVVWRITREHAVPWMIPVQFSWCNKKAVSPKNATLSEMYECSRIQQTNSILYEKDDIYKSLLQHLMFMEKHVMFDPSKAPVGTQCSLFTNWFNPDYVFCKRCFKVLVLYDSEIKWSTFLAFKPSIVQNNLQKIIVPTETVIAALDGEIRPQDAFSEDLYALQLIDKCTSHWFGDSRDPRLQLVTFLVNTLVCSDTRPGVGGSGFFANTTCADHVLFKCTPHWLDPNRIGTVITNSENTYRHSMITTSEPITGQMILDREWRVEGLEEFVLLPVEWHYSNQLEDATTKKIPCKCMTNCRRPGCDEKQILVNNSTGKREDRNWTEAMVEAEPGLTNVKKNGIIKYLQDYGVQ